MKKKETSSGANQITKIAIGLILIMAFLIVYVVVNHNEISQEQYYKRLQYLNAK